VLDFHNHLIPGVDDGAASLEESLSALKKMWVQGIRHVITTPHFRASTINRPKEFAAQMARIDEAWAILLRAAPGSVPEMRLDRGVELALDEPNFPLSDSRLRLAGTQFMLVEFPYFTVPPNSGQALGQLRRSGIIPIVAHPERYDNMGDGLELLADWNRSGAFLQLNAGSVVGAYGSRPEKLAWRCLEAGAVDYISSDYHSRGKCLVAEAGRRIADRGGESQFRVLTGVNGARLIAGAEPAAVMPLARPRWGWRHLTKAILGKLRRDSRREGGDPI
jgi:protein-tyrosine phosphatase